MSQDERVKIWLADLEALVEDPSDNHKYLDWKVVQESLSLEKSNSVRPAIDDVKDILLA